VSIAVIQVARSYAAASQDDRTFSYTCRSAVAFLSVLQSFVCSAKPKATLPSHTHAGPRLHCHQYTILYAAPSQSLTFSYTWSSAVAFLAVMRR
jgi:hypothetical protein